MSEIFITVSATSGNVFAPKFAFTYHNPKTVWKFKENCLTQYKVQFTVLYFEYDIEFVAGSSFPLLYGKFGKKWYSFWCRW